MQFESSARHCVSASIAVLVATISCAVGIRTAHCEPAADSRFHFKEIDDKGLGLWEGERPVLVYNFGERSLPGVREAGTRSSYVHPIYGIEGEVLTDDFPVDHYHHHGLFWGWPHVTVGGREYDLWKMRGIRIDFKRWLEKDASAKGARLGVENAWMVRDKAVVKEEVWLDIGPASEDDRAIDVTLSWTPTEPITLGGAEGKSYGGLTLRYAPRTETAITIPEGRASEDLLITKLPWANLSGKFKGATKPSGAAVFVDPGHPDFPPEWMTRDYGALAVGWPGVQSKTLEPDKTVTCRYRVWIHTGIRDAPEIAKVYKAFATSRESDSGAK